MASASRRSRRPATPTTTSAFLVNDTVCFTADLLFKDAVGGGPDAGPIRHSVMEVLMTLAPEVRVLPGHTEETTIGREWEENPFVTSGAARRRPMDEPVGVGRGGDARRLVARLRREGKALVRFGDGHEAIVGGSRVER